MGPFRAAPVSTGPRTKGVCTPLRKREHEHGEHPFDWGLEITGCRASSSAAPLDRLLET